MIMISYLLRFPLLSNCCFIWLLLSTQNLLFYFFEKHSVKEIVAFIGWQTEWTSWAISWTFSISCYEYEETVIIYCDIDRFLYSCKTITSILTVEIVCYLFAETIMIRIVCMFESSLCCQLTDFLFVPIQQLVNEMQSLVLRAAGSRYYQHSVGLIYEMLVNLWIDRHLKNLGTENLLLIHELLEFRFDCRGNVCVC